MINKFSDSVRRNQKQWMVVITILAVFAFLFDDLARSTQAGAAGNVIFLAALCAGGMAILGYRRGQTTEFAVTGLVVGALVAFISVRASGPPVVVKTNVGSYTRADLNAFRSKRLKVDHFLTAVGKATANERGVPRFGSVDDGSMVSFALLQREARRMGVSLKDDSVNQFLTKATQGKLSPADYRAALREAGLSEGELFDSVRQELEVQMVAQLISAPAEAHPTMAQFTRGAYSGRIAQQTPEQLWRSFQKLHVRQALSTVAVPVEEFAKLVQDPPEGELRDFFEKHKNNFYDERNGTPGFLEPPKVRLAYLVAANLEAHEKQVPEITDQDVADYYLANKESYRVFDIPEPSSKLPDLNPNAASNSPADSAPADATKTDNASDDKATPPAGDAKPENKPSEPKSPDASEKGKDTPAEKAPAKDGDSKDGVPCDDAAPESKAASIDAAKPDADADDAKPADAPAKPEAKEDGEKPSEDKSPPAPALPSDDKTTATDSPEKPPALDALPMPAPAARYRELDDDLKEQIRETVRTDKALATMSEVSDEALEMMMELSLDYMSVEVKERDQAAVKYSAQLKEYAEKHGLEYKETEEMSQLAMMTSLDERIGSATDPVSATGASRRQTSVAEEVFEMEGSGRGGYRLSMFSPRRADIPRGARYTYWKTLEVPAKPPELKDALVHKKVLEAWKLEKARPLAEKRANELVALIKKGEADIAAALSGQTINGTNDSPAASIRETAKFSWLRLPQSLPQFGLQQPTESTIDGIGQPGFAFMKAIFDDMQDGDVKVVANASRNSFFVVRVHDRDGVTSDVEGVALLADLQKQFLREQFSNFLPTPYEFIGAEIQAMVDNRWRAGFRQRFGIDFESNAALVPDDE